MQEKTQKIITWVCLAIAIIGTIFAVVFALDQTKFSSMFNVAYGILLGFIAVSILAILYFLVMRTIKGQGKGLLIGIAALVVVAVIAFLLSSNSDVSAYILEKNGVTAGTSKIVGAGCIMVYILAIAAICSIIYVEIAKAFKK